MVLWTNFIKLTLQSTFFKGGVGAVSFSLPETAYFFQNNTIKLGVRKTLGSEPFMRNMKIS